MGRRPPRRAARPDLRGPDLRRVVRCGLAPARARGRGLLLATAVAPRASRRDDPRRRVRLGPPEGRPGPRPATTRRSRPGHARRPPAHKLVSLGACDGRLRMRNGPRARRTSPALAALRARGADRLLACLRRRPLSTGRRGGRDPRRGDRLRGSLRRGGDQDAGALSRRGRALKKLKRSTQAILNRGRPLQGSSRGRNPLLRISVAAQKGSDLGRGAALQGSSRGRNPLLRISAAAQ